MVTSRLAQLHTSAKDLLPNVAMDCQISCSIHIRGNQHMYRGSGCCCINVSVKRSALQLQTWIIAAPLKGSVLQLLKLQHQSVFLDCHHLQNQGHLHTSTSCHLHDCQGKAYLYAHELLLQADAHDAPLRNKARPSLPLFATTCS